MSQKGQSTIEFTLTLILLVAFTLFYFQLSMVFAFGNYVHYATFMAARAYLSAGSDNGEQVGRAKDVAIRMLKRSLGQTGTDKFPSIAKGTGGSDPPGLEIGPGSNYNETDSNSSWMRGVRYTFRSRVFLIPFAGFGKGAKEDNANLLTLTSESWLGRDPPYDECQSIMGDKRWAYDNGC